MSKGKMARRKGHNFEREIAKRFREVYPRAHRHLEYQGIEANGVDIMETGSYKIQCKRGRKFASISAINEVSFDEFLGEVPVLVTQGDRTQIMAVIPLDEFLSLIQRASKR